MISICCLCSILKAQDKVYENIYNIYQEYDSSRTQYSSTQFNVSVFTQIDLNNYKLTIGNKEYKDQHVVFTIQSVLTYSNSNTTVLKCLNESMNYMCTVKLYNDSSYHIFEIIYSDANRFKYKQLMN